MISLIIPTYNEKENVLELIRRAEEVFLRAGEAEFEILILDDDSPDGTSQVVLELKDPRVRLVNRRGRPRGLSAAVIDGFREAKGEIIGVMDADMSHPPEVLPSLIRAIREGYSVAVGSRYVPGGGIQDWPAHRVFASRLACMLAGPLTPVKDATSGFFFLKKTALENVKLDPLGFKIGLEVFVRSKHGGKIKEVPYVFTDRRAGMSKLKLPVIGCYLKQICILLKGRYFAK